MSCCRPLFDARQLCASLSISTKPSLHRDTVRFERGCDGRARRGCQVGREKMYMLLTKRIFQIDCSQSHASKRWMWCVEWVPYLLVHFFERRVIV